MSPRLFVLLATLLMCVATFVVARIIIPGLVNLHSDGALVLGVVLVLGCIAAAAVAEAEGQAKATRLKNEAVAVNPGYQNEFFRRWDGRLPQTVYCAADKPCLNIPGQ